MYMYIHIYVYVHTYVYIYIYARIHIHIYIYIYICVTCIDFKNSLIPRAPEAKGRRGGGAAERRLDV